jgi:hypothetical protein
MYLSKQLISTCIASTLLGIETGFARSGFLSLLAVLSSLYPQSMMELSNEREGCWQERDHCCEL